MKRIFKSLKIIAKNTLTNLIILSEWIRFNELLWNVPLNIDDPSRYLDYNKILKQAMMMYHYFVHINERKKEGETAAN